MSTEIQTGASPEKSGSAPLAAGGDVAPSVGSPPAVSTPIDNMMAVASQTDDRSFALSNVNQVNLHELGNFSGEDRPFIDRFAEIAVEEKLSLREFEGAVRWALRVTEANCTKENFYDWAYKNEWRDKEIRAVLRRLPDIFSGTPAKPAQSAKTILEPDELEQIRALIKDPRSSYWRGPRSEALQRRYRELVR